MTGTSRKLLIAAERLRPVTPSAGQPQAGSAPDGDMFEDIGNLGGDRLAAVARAEYAARRRRDHLFDADIIAEPAWDMLLDLYIQRHQERPVSVHSLCIAAAVPQTTALRWIGKLAHNGLIDRRPCTHDNRVVHISLSNAGLELMERYLQDQLGQSGVDDAAPLSFS